MNGFSHTILRLPLLLAAGLLAACAAPLPLNAPPKPVPVHAWANVDVAFVTNRQLEKHDNGDRYYGGDRGSLSAGRCTVALEKQGALDAEVLGVTEARLDEILSGLQNRGLVLYVHGFNESFRRSCERAALLQQQLGLAGRFLLFSWPAERLYLTYAHDAGELASSLEQLAELIEMLGTRHGASNLSLVGHSLGARGLFSLLSSEDPDGGTASVYGRLVLVAPDIGRSEFLAGVDGVLQRVDGITVYVSDKDRALRMSTLLNASTRLGLSAHDVVEIDGVEVVDVSETGIYSFSGHVYHLLNPAVIEDLRRLLDGGLRTTRPVWHRVKDSSAGR